MNILIDFSQSQYAKVHQLSQIDQINQITFVIPFFVFIQTNFAPLLEYIVFLKQNLLINAKVKPLISEQQKKKLQKFDVVSVRGTFDRLHIGHQLLLLNAIYSTKQQLIIQIKGDMLIQNKKLKQLVQSFQVRKQAIESFVQNVKPELKIKIVQIQQIYGNAPNSKSIQAIVVSEQSIFSSKHINKLRKQNGLKKASIIITPVVTSNNLTKQLRIQNKVSSRNIRQAILSANNFTVSQYLSYKNIWDYLVKQINSLCNIKDVDFVKAYKWFQRIIIFHLFNGTNSNKQILQKITNSSTPQHQSLSEIAQNLKMFLKGVKTQKESQLKGVCKEFLQNILKKKSKICKKVKKMILKEIQSNSKEKKRKFHQQKTKVYQQKDVLINQTHNATKIKPQQIKVDGETLDKLSANKIHLQKINNNQL